LFGEAILSHRYQRRYHVNNVKKNQHFIVQTPTRFACKALLLLLSEGCLSNSRTKDVTVSFRKIAKSKYWLRRVCLSARLSGGNNFVPTGEIFMKFDIGEFFENLSKEFEFH
jgi:hypothetical protein